MPTGSDGSRTWSIVDMWIVVDSATVGGVRTQDGLLRNPILFSSDTG
jgi:hypothetical protein